MLIKEKFIYSFYLAALCQYFGLLIYLWRVRLELQPADTSKCCATLLICAIAQQTDNSIVAAAVAWR